MPAGNSSNSEVTDTSTKGQPQRFRSTRTRLCGKVTELARTRLGLIQLFQRCSSGLVDMLAERVQYKVFEAGAEIIKEGEVGNCMYVLNVGEVDVVVGEQNVAKLTSGSMFGEMAAMCKDRAAAVRTATIVAVTVCDCYVIERQQLQTCLSAYPQDEALIAAEARARLDSLIERGLIEDSRSEKRRLSYYMLTASPPEPDKTNWKKASRRLSALRFVQALEPKHQQSKSEEVQSPVIPSKPQLEERSTSDPSALTPDASSVGFESERFTASERHTAPEREMPLMYTPRSDGGQLNTPSAERIQSMSTVMSQRNKDTALGFTGRLCLTARERSLPPVKGSPGRSGSKGSQQPDTPGSSWSIGRTKAEVDIYKDVEAFLAERDIFSDEDVFRIELPRAPMKHRSPAESRRRYRYAEDVRS